MKAQTQGTDVQYLSSEHRDRAWRDRFNARWHYDYGGWIRTRPQDDASTFALIPDERYGPFVEDHSCPYCLVIHPPQECPVLSRYARQGDCVRLRHDAQQDTSGYSRR
jgi:hypothetical protein